MIDWQNIDTVLLDMDGTLLDLHYDNHFWITHLPKRYAEINAIDVDDAQQLLAKKINSQQGTLNWYCLDYWSEILNLDIPTLKKETRTKINLRPHAIEFLRFLQRQKKRIYLVTNAHPAGIDIKFEETGINHYFDEVITSHQFRAPKEATSFWLALQKKLAFNCERTLLIDDNVTVLNTAKAFGIAYALGIHQPDSQSQRTLTDTTAIHHFTEIMH